jgi:hypothetical protein
MYRSSGSRFHRRAPPQRSSPELAPVTIWWRGCCQSISRSVLVQVVCVDHPGNRLLIVSGDRRRRASIQSTYLTWVSQRGWWHGAGPLVSRAARNQLGTKSLTNRTLTGHGPRGSWPGPGPTSLWLWLGISSVQYEYVCYFRNFRK